MAISNYSTLKQAVANWTARTAAASFTSRIPEFIAAAETRIFYGGEAPMDTGPVRCSDMETSVDLTVADDNATLPERFLEFKRLYWPGSPNVRFLYYAPRDFWTEDDTGLTEPYRYTIETGKVWIKPGGDGTLKATYWKRYAPLSADTDTNWLLENAHNVYLQAALIEAYQYLRMPDQQSNALAAYKSAADAVTKQSTISRVSGEKLIVRSTMWS